MGDDRRESVLASQVDHVCFASPETEKAFTAVLIKGKVYYLVIDAVDKSNGCFEGKLKGESRSKLYG